MFVPIKTLAYEPSVHEQEHPLILFLLLLSLHIPLLPHRKGTALHSQKEFFENLIVFAVSDRPYYFQLIVVEVFIFKCRPLILLIGHSNLPYLVLRYEDAQLGCIFAPVQEIRKQTLPISKAHLILELGPASLTVSISPTFPVLDVREKTSCKTCANKVAHRELHLFYDFLLE